MMVGTRIPPSTDSALYQI